MAVLARRLWRRCSSIVGDDDRIRQRVEDSVRRSRCKSSRSGRPELLDHEQSQRAKDGEHRALERVRRCEVGMPSSDDVAGADRRDAAVGGARGRASRPRLYEFADRAAAGVTANFAAERGRSSLLERKPRAAPGARGYRSRPVHERSGATRVCLVSRVPNRAAPRIESDGSRNLQELIGRSRVRSRPSRAGHFSQLREEEVRRVTIRYPHDDGARRPLYRRGIPR